MLTILQVEIKKIIISESKSDSTPEIEESDLDGFKFGNYDSQDYSNSNSNSNSNSLDLKLEKRESYIKSKSDDSKSETDLPVQIPSNYEVLNDLELEQEDKEDQISNENFDKLNRSESLTDLKEVEICEISEKDLEIDLLGIDLETLAQNRNIFDDKIDTHRSNMKIVLTPSNISQKGSRASKPESESNEIGKLLLKDPHALGSESLSHFEFFDHQKHEDLVPSISNPGSDSHPTDVPSRLRRTSHGVLSGLGSLSNVTQLLDRPVLRMSKLGSRLSGELGLFDGSTMFQEERVPLSVAGVESLKSRLSIDNFFSNLKNCDELGADYGSGIGSIKGPFFTGVVSRSPEILDQGSLCDYYKLIMIF